MRKKRKILWNSDLWGFCLVGAVVAMLFFVGACVQWSHRQSGESFGLALTGAFILGVATFGALIDRSEAMRRAVLFSDASVPPRIGAVPDDPRKPS